MHLNYNFLSVLFLGRLFLPACSSHQLHISKPHTVFLLNANFYNIQNVCEVVMSLLSLLQLCICQLSRLRVFDVVFHFSFSFSDSSRVYFGCLGYKKDCTKMSSFTVNVFLFFRCNVFFFITEAKKKEMKV